MTGIVCRQAQATAADVRQLVADVVGLPCWSFAGASLWAAKAKLDPIEEIATTDDLNLESDFGHAFALAGEVRWKRVSRDQYDVLILPAAPFATSNLATLGNYTLRPAAERAWMLLELPGGTVDQRWRLGYVEYLGAGKEVRFIRYTQLRRF